MKAEEIKQHKGKGLINMFFGGSTVRAMDEVKRLESQEEYEACLKVLNDLEEDHPEKRKEVGPVRRRIQLKVMASFLEAYSGPDSLAGLGLDDLAGLLEQVETFYDLATPVRKRQLIQLRGWASARRDELLVETRLAEMRTLLDQDRYVDAYLVYVEVEDRLAEDARSSCRNRLIAGLIRRCEEHGESEDEEGLTRAIEIAEILLSLTGEDRYLTWQQKLRRQLSIVERLKEAREALAEGRLDLALSKVRQLLDDAPDHPEGVRLLQEILDHLRAQYLQPAEEALARGDLDDAERRAGEYGAIVGDTDDGHRPVLDRCAEQKTQAEEAYQRALAHYRAGEWNDASEQLDKCFRLHREHREATHLNVQLQGIVSFVGGDPAKLRTFRQASVRIGRAWAEGSCEIAFSDRFLSRSAYAVLSYEGGRFVLAEHGKIELTLTRGEGTQDPMDGKVALQDGDRIGFSPLLQAVFKEQGSLAKLIFSPVDLGQIKREYRAELAPMVAMLNHEVAYVYLIDATGRR